MNYIAILFWSLIAQSCCKPDGYSVSSDSLKLNAYVDYVQYLEHRGRCDCTKATSVEVVTKYFTVPDSLYLDGFLYMSQYIRLKVNNDIIEVQNPIFRKANVNFKGQSISVMSTVIRRVKCIKDGDDYIYMFYGSNSVDPPNEFFGALSPTGEWTWYFYGSTHDTYAKKGKTKQLISRFGKQQVNSLDDMTSVLP